MATKQYMNVKSAATLWNLTERRVRILCSEGRVDGVIRNGWAWNIPVGTAKPQDGRCLRHIKNISLRPGAANYSELDKFHQQFIVQKDDEGYVSRTFRSSLASFVTGAFALDDIAVDKKEVDRLFEGERPSLPLEQMLLSLNCRTTLNRTIQETGFGPLPGRVHDEPYLSERKIKKIAVDLHSGIDDFYDGAYRKASIPAGCSDDYKVFSIEQQMAILMYQYEKEWQMLHPLVRSAFLFGELMRIRPFGVHDGMIALIVMSEELLASGYPPLLLNPEQIEELRADLSLTQRRGNYQSLIALMEGSLLRFQKELMRKKEEDA